MATVMLLTQQDAVALHLARGHKHIPQPFSESRRDKGGEEMPSVTNPTLAPLRWACKTKQSLFPLNRPHLAPTAHQF